MSVLTDGPATRSDSWDLTDAMLAAAQRCAARFGCAAALHPDDYILRYIAAHADDPTEAVDAYFETGHGAALLLRSLLDEPRVRSLLDLASGRERPLRLLDFAAGYGRVTRHLPAVLPGIDIAGCDIHRAAVEAMREAGLAGLLSSHDPDALALGARFDVIFCFSFFTHLPRMTWRRWLAALERHLDEHGVLIMTTHGEVSRQLMGVPALEPDGFFFHTVSEQHDLPGSEYGNAVTTFDFVFEQLLGCRLRLIQYKEAGAGHHDIYVLQKDSERPHVSPGSPAMSARIATLQAFLHAMRTSRSWRLTAPLRALAMMLRKGDAA